MKSTLLPLFLVLILGILGATATDNTCPSLPSNVNVILLLEDNNIVWFPPNSKSFRATALSGVEGTLLAIDGRPNGRTLWGFSDRQVLYTIDLSSGQATRVSSLSTPLNGRNIGMDFNPTVDRLRLVSSSTNYRVNVDTGEVTVDLPLAFVSGDRNEGRNPNLSGIAYTNNTHGATVTSLYGVDFRNNRFTLVLFRSPNNGTLTTVGSLGVRGDRLAGFDIYTSNQGCQTALFATDSRFYFVDLSTGRATPVWSQTTTAVLQNYLCDLDVRGLAIL